MSAYVFDSETTGLIEPVIIEAAWLKLGSVSNVYDLAGHFVQRFNPNKLIETGAMATHHILDEDVADCEPATDFRLPDDAEYIIGHNVDYDWAAIGSPNVKRICTLALARNLWPQSASHTQSALLYQLCDDRAVMREKLRGAHSALVDVENCLHLLGHILSALGTVTSWDELWQHSEAARIPSVMPFGKHKGMEISRIPADYKRWLLNQPDVDPYLMRALEA